MFHKKTQTNTEKGKHQLWAYAMEKTSTLTSKYATLDRCNAPQQVHHANDHIRPWNIIHLWMFIIILFAVISVSAVNVFQDLTDNTDYTIRNRILC